MPFVPCFAAPSYVSRGLRQLHWHGRELESSWGGFPGGGTGTYLQVEDLLLCLVARGGFSWVSTEKIISCNTVSGFSICFLVTKPHPTLLSDKISKAFPLPQRVFMLLFQYIICYALLNLSRLKNLLLCIFMRQLLIMALWHLFNKCTEIAVRLLSAEGI